MSLGGFAAANPLGGRPTARGFAQAPPEGLRPSGGLRRLRLGGQGRVAVAATGSGVAGSFGRRRDVQIAGYEGYSMVSST